MEHLDRRRAGSFGDAADVYDEARPSYPPELVELLLEDAPLRALDVGCGTGKVARLLMARGVRVLGIEPDARMAAVAGRHGVEVEVSSFETWDTRGRTVPLLVCGQAWHWIDPTAGAAKAAAVLVPGGRWVAFWNRRGGTVEGDVRRRLDEAYARWAPEMRPPARHDRFDPDDPVATGLAATEVFGPVVHRELRWREEVDTATYVRRISTYSDHWALPGERRAALLDAVAAAIDASGGSVELGQRTDVLCARRLTAPG
jgi:SAM-dependent methyltransferase